MNFSIESIWNGPVLAYEINGQKEIKKLGSQNVDKLYKLLKTLEEVDPLKYIFRFSLVSM